MLYLNLKDGHTACLSDGTAVNVDELPVPFVGFELLPDIVPDVAAEAALLREIDMHPWQESQSGRRKQDFGPRANFKRQRLKIPIEWRGLPRYAHQLLTRLCTECQGLKNFEVAEYLALEYSAARSANHAFHIDDTWLWGERIIGVSLRSSTVITFYEPCSRTALRVSVPNRSAYVLSSNVRYAWQHGILADDIDDVRIALTFRELEPELAATEVGQL